MMEKEFIIFWVLFSIATIISVCGIVLGAISYTKPKEDITHHKQNEINDDIVVKGDLTTSGDVVLKSKVGISETLTVKKTLVSNSLEATKYIRFPRIVLGRSLSEYIRKKADYIKLKYPPISTGFPGVFDMSTLTSDKFTKLDGNMNVNFVKNVTEKTASIISLEKGLWNFILEGKVTFSDFAEQSNVILNTSVISYDSTLTFFKDNVTSVSSSIIRGSSYCLEKSKTYSIRYSGMSDFPVKAGSLVGLQVSTEGTSNLSITIDNLTLTIVKV